MTRLTAQILREVPLRRAVARFQARDIRRLLLIFAVLTIPALAADAAVAISTSFVRPWVEAMRANSPARLAGFLHPSVRACINDQTREYFEFGTISS
ncbi:MAG: hypothetical protein ABSG41_11940 [Bryobacteraceae bacterium]|jgi:hypothetical protein